MVAQVKNYLGINNSNYVFLERAAMIEYLKLLYFVQLLDTYSNSTSFVSYDWIFYLSLYPEAGLRYIRFKFSAAIFAAILKNVQPMLLILTFLNSSSSTSYE